MSINEGGSAFPVRSRWDHANEGFDLRDSGMTLRDYFAANNVDTAYCHIEAKRGNKHPSMQDVAETAYKLADAMLAAREKEEMK